LGARGGERKESNPPRGILPYVPFPGDPSPLGFFSCFHLETGKREIQKIMKYLKNSGKSRKKIENMTKTISRI